ncbi:hypothetical protein GCM10010199_61040 [Dactylosporangium roseum]
MAENDWSLVDGLPVATAQRTIDDLAGERIDRGHLAGIVRDALYRHQVMEDELPNTLARHARGYGARTGDGQGLLRVLVEEAGITNTWESPLTGALRSIDHAVMQGITSSVDPGALRAITAQLDPELLHRIAAWRASVLASHFAAEARAAAAQLHDQTDKDPHARN